MQICIFGDSTAWGAWDLEKGGWVNRLWFFLHNKEPYSEIYNLSVSGGTAQTILDRFEGESRIRGGNLLVFQTGANDASCGPDKVPLIPEDKFRANIQEIIERAKKITPHFFFVGAENCDESKTVPVSWGDYYYTNENIRKYNEIMRQVCEESHVLFVDVFGMFEPTDLHGDGLHLSEMGHEKIFEKVKPVIGKILEIDSN